MNLTELRRQAKEQGLKGYSTLCKDDLELLLDGKPVPKKLRKNQRSVETQTDFPPCNDCGLKAYMTHLSFKAQERRRIIHDGDLEIDAKSGEVLGCGVDYSRHR
jgi:hypothetical protein